MDLDNDLAKKYLEEAVACEYDDWEAIMKSQMEVTNVITRKTSGKSTFRDTETDNNCLFRCASLVLTETQRYHEEIRRITFAYFKRNQELFRDYGGNKLLDDKAYEQRVEHIENHQSKLGIQGEEPAILGIC